MRYFFILGNNPTLSIAEISAVFGLREKNKTKSFLANKKVFILKIEKEIDCEKIIKKIGGIIKIGRIIDKTEKNNLNIKIMNLLEKKESCKMKFGISFYGEEKFNIKKLAMQVKKDLKKENIEGKWISSKFSNDPLSSVTIEKNKLTKKGKEVVLMENNGKILIGETLAVQPFEDLSFRDYNRPSRDDRSGMIPPKLAQIMLNLAIPVDIYHNIYLQDKIIYDPFCGSGTILSEVALMGCKTIIGSDVSSRAIKDTEENLKWISEKYKLDKLNTNIFQLDSQSVSKYLRKPIIDVIVTEPYLGPQRGKISINRVRKQLEQLYSNSLQEFRKILKPSGRIVMIWPIFRINKKSFEINPKIDGYKIISPLPEDLRKNKNTKLTNRKTIIYGRPDQRVWREIVVLDLEK